MKCLLILLVLLLAVLPSGAIAHSGGTDGNGGHTDSRDGSYHKHNGGDSGGSSGGGRWNSKATVIVICFVIFVGVILFAAWMEDTTSAHKTMTRDRYKYDEYESRVRMNVAANHQTEDKQSPSESTGEYVATTFQDIIVVASFMSIMIILIGVAGNLNELNEWVIGFWLAVIVLLFLMAVMASPSSDDSQMNQEAELVNCCEEERRIGNLYCNTCGKVTDPRRRVD